MLMIGQFTINPLPWKVLLVVPLGVMLQHAESSSPSAAERCSKNPAANSPWDESF